MLLITVMWFIVVCLLKPLWYCQSALMYLSSLLEIVLTDDMFVVLSIHFKHLVRKRYIPMSLCKQIVSELHFEQLKLAILHSPVSLMTRFYSCSVSRTLYQNFSILYVLSVIVCLRRECSSGVSAVVVGEEMCLCSAV
jgi:hypothetical protein